MANARVKFFQLLRTAAITDGRVALAASNIWVQRVTLLGKKSLSGTANVGSVSVGCSSSASEQPYLITTGAECIIECGAGAEFNLADWYFVVATDNDGLVVMYH